MNQEKIGKFIKEIRTNNKLSQQMFADKYGVTPQAVSKWENGKSLPDISILKQICNDYNLNLDDLLENKISNKKNNIFLIILTIVAVLLIVVLILFFHNKNNNDFNFKTLSTTCDNFNLYGSIAYNSNKTSIYISHITYCGGDDDILYDKIDCTLYETYDVKTEIRKCDVKDNVTLEDFLKNVSFNVDHYDTACNMYKENSLQLEINATKDGKITTYRIPLELEDNCRN